ncbi:hypothetical protein [Dysgonomonas sp. ZJ279]|uniref:hypothetical protein n=1 Tax=Dysgonomonas sp. ZJ279 TaxID=2709796 RepID=UPI0013E9F318|nr:hypothetical protein [Dysgonomonas sp. ZJ279]
MKNILILSILISFLLISCKSKTIYVPVESVKTEYKDRLYRDSVYLHDSIMIKMKGDTVWYEKYKTVYKDKLVRDSVFITDSVQVPYPVIEQQEVNRLSSFQSFQIWCGRILLILLILYFGLKR